MCSDLSGGYEVFNGVDTQTQDVVRVLQVEALLVLLLVVDHPHCRHVVHDLTILGVEQVVTAVVTTVPAQINTMWSDCKQSLVVHHVVHNLTILGVEQVVTAVVTTVPAHK